MNRIQPRALKKGDTVGLVAPASSAALEKVDGAVKALESFGLQVLVGQSCYEKMGYLSGSDELRVTELNGMFANPQVNGIVCLRGGYGTPRILDRLDYDVIRRHPKVFVGFSDITAVHTAIQNNAGLITFHGPMGALMAGDFGEYSRKFWSDMLFGEIEAGPLFNPLEEELIGYQGGVARGLLCGGNLSLIADTMGTPYEINCKDKILFIEEIDEEPYQIDRMLTQLRLAGKLSEAAGIILGDFADCSAKDPSSSLTLEEVLQGILPKDKPILQNLRAGHCEPHMMLALHSMYEIDGSKGELRLLESPVRKG